MALLVGIDEAGYGPHLGPLVVAAAAIEFATPPAPPTPSRTDLWGPSMPTLETAVGVEESRGHLRFEGGVRRRQPGNDRRAVLGAMAATGLQPASFAALLDHTAVRSAADGEAAPAPWHRPHALALPRSASPEAVAEAAARLTEALAGSAPRRRRLGQRGVGAG